MGRSAAPDACPSWLLVGNSRWHWARATASGLQIDHWDPREARSLLSSQTPRAWAAVGRLPEDSGLDPACRVLTGSVPLPGAPAWLGVDRALAAWLAWQDVPEAVLVADAGTVLSLTLVGADGGFAGGRLLAGCGLQLRAMVEGTAALAPPIWPPLQPEPWNDDAWPQRTDAAMTTGVVLALAAAVASAFAEARGRFGDCRLVLTGGDAESIAPALQGSVAEAGGRFDLEADLPLRALVALRPAAQGSSA